MSTYFVLTRFYEARQPHLRSDDYTELNSHLRMGQTGNEYFDNETRLLKSTIAKTQTIEA